jgi:amidohydrolase
MDALPIQEENQVDYVSESAGLMHACGHDGHVSIALGLATLLSAQRERLHGRVKFVFQPAEEIAGGAQAMIDDGVLSDPTPDFAIGLHLWNDLPLGRVLLREGAVMSGAAHMNMVISGKGGHAALPHLTADPVTCAAQMINGLNTLVSRRMNPLAGPVVLSVTSIETSSHAFNVIPEQITLMGTFRSFDRDAGLSMEGHVRSLCEATAAAMGCTVELEIRHITTPVVNNSEVVRRARSVLDGYLAADQIETELRWMASEDVSYFLDRVPGLFLLVGSANADQGLDFGHHHPRFDFDEDALPLSVGLMAALAAEFLMIDGE